MLQGISTAFNVDLVYKYTLNGPIFWLAIITILSIIASMLPARDAEKVSFINNANFDQNGLLTG